MDFRFQRRIKILPFVTLNLGETGASVTVGGRGAHITIGKNGIVRTRIGLPGTGISVGETWNKSSSEKEKRIPRN